MSQEPVSKQSANASDRSISEQVSVPLRVAAAWSWRILIVIVTVSVIVWGLRYVASIVVAVLVALLLALLLAPLLSFLRGKLHMGKTSSAAVGLVSGLILVTGLMAIALGQVVAQLPALVSQTLGGLDDLLAWVQDGPLGLDFAFLDGFLESFQDDLTSVLRNYGGVIASEAWSFATSAVSLAASALIALFTLFFMLKDGRSMWIWFLRCLPKQWREQTNEAGIRGWVTLGSYIRTQLKVAGIDAIGIGLGAFALGVPAAIPIMVLVFFFSFIPIVGAFISGAVAVLLALVNKGVTSPIIMLLVVLAVQQIESNVLQPWLMSNAVSLHPVAVVLAVTAGSAVAGIVGAIFAVPLLAFINVTLMYLHGHDMFPELVTDDNRPGGPPGSLQEQITASYWTARKVNKGSGKKGNADAGRVEIEQAIVAGPEVSGAP